ncbi:MAG: glycosyltransferase family 4 protein [Sedimentitalea sp.]|nr:glycosyltransferase family 4 protein [Sedimentitalea sp.]
MPGDGTKLAITSNSPPARLLDISRLIRRAGRLPTGIDRVERAYLRHLLSRPEPLFALARTTLGYVLLDGRGAAGIAERIEGALPWGTADRLSLLARGKPEPVRRAESDLRRLALDRGRPNRLTATLAKHLPSGVAYLNVGHSNLTDRTLWAVRHGAQGRIAVMIHDTIPLDFPQLQRPGTPETFRGLLRRVRARADLVIHTTEATRTGNEAHMAAWGPVPPGVVAPLGVPVPVPDPSSIPTGLDLGRPYFVILGTIEPRKGHDLLLDIWQAMARDRPAGEVPGLLICGARGWVGRDVLDRLDGLAPDGPVRELPDLGDGAVAALLSGARALLFPSRAEGFGLPPMEAASLGVPVLASDLPSLREILREFPVYVANPDPYQWRDKIEALAQGHGARPGEAVVPPGWEAHFNTVLRLT